MPDDEALESLTASRASGAGAPKSTSAGAWPPGIWPVDDLAVAVGLQWLLSRDERPARAELLASANPGAHIAVRRPDWSGIITFRFGGTPPGESTAITLVAC